jgi:5-formyltetrahydrofolate cyclo-ligase
VNIKERKIELRKRMTRLRGALTPEERRNKTAAINRTVLEEAMKRLDASAASGRRPTLFTYLPYQTEVDVTSVIEACWDKGYRVCAPKSFPEDRRMRLHEINSFDDVKQGNWGVREPLPSQPVLSNIHEIDVILVPGLAFDPQMGRLGYGGGYYDRFVQQYTKHGAPRPYLIVAAFDVQIVSEVPIGMFDFRVDRIITESRVLSVGTGAKR